MGGNVHGLRCLDLLNGRRQRDAGGREYPAAHALGLAAQEETPPVLIHLGMVEADQVARRVAPLEFFTAGDQSVVEFLAQYERQKRAEHVPTNGRIALVPDRGGSSSDFIERNACSTIHSCLYFNATSAADR